MKLSQYTLLNTTREQHVPLNRYIIYCRKSSESDERQIQSLPDQITTLMTFITSKGLQVSAEPLQESKSAKIPGRPVFDQLIQMIEEGTVNGIILLNPSRLSRNTVDTGRIIYLMDQGKLQEVVTPYQTFKNNPLDKFMLNLLCTQAKLENDNKSVNVKESLKLKAERGVFPGKARPGYMNNRDKPQGLRDISAHPVYFPLMRKLFDLALTGNYSVERLGKEAGKLGIRSSKSGKPICKSWMHRLLRDPFYTGKFMYGGKLYQGNHPALLTDDEFNLLQDIVEGRTKGKQQKHDFALTGILTCGECQYAITAEKHIRKYKNGQSQLFAYYRCTKKGKDTGEKCNQAFASTTKIEDKLAEDLGELQLMPEFAELALEALEKIKKQDQSVTKSSYEALQTALNGVNKRITNLVSLKISPDNSDGSLLSDEEFADRKRALVFEKEKLMKQLEQQDPNNSEWAEIGKDSFDFGLRASRRFSKGGTDDKKIIFKTVGSKPILLDQKLQFQLRYLFFQYKQGVQKTKEEINRLESNNSLSDQSNLKEYLKSP
ncbi:MAG TPA: recombinase family protein, partial [Candidatus Saccharimonadales bacterium]|nr:recombinase family protein [Candidatus Saccharimonadales bacterium]